MSIERIHELPTPDEVKSLFPVSEKCSSHIDERRREIANVFTGQDQRIVLIIGPCSADTEDGILRYVEKLARVQEKVADKVLVIPRVYTSKPRTNGKGYKGLMHQPDLSLPPDICEGVIAMRKIHHDVVAQTELIGADELLYPNCYQYIDDLLGYVAIGARSTEDQEHRLIASGIDVPVGMKNPTSGDLAVMMNSITAGQSPHEFMYGSWACESDGNPLCHAILRGFTDEAGTGFANYHYENIVRVQRLYEERPDLENPALVIDCNHANSHKDPFEQPRIAREVMRFRNINESMHGFIKGLMVESYLEDGRQDIGSGVYGQSITDSCLGWEKTERLVNEIADMA